MIGTTLGHYRIVELIGKGGMGEVYLADDTRLQRRVALKVLARELAGDPDRRERFDREARAAAALNHPNIVTIHSVEEAGGVPFLTLELIDGQTLADLDPRRRSPARPAADAGHSAGRRRRRRPPARHHASRSEARQRDGHDRWPAEGARLRPRQTERRRAAGPRGGPAHRNAHRRRTHRRHGRVHVAGTGGREAGRSEVRCVLAGCDPLRDGDGRATFHRRHADVDPVVDHEGCAEACDRSETRPAARFFAHCHALPGEGRRRSVPKSPRTCATTCVP